MSDPSPTIRGRLSQISLWLMANPLLSGLGLLAIAGAVAMTLLAITPMLDSDSQIDATVDEVLVALQSTDYDRARQLAMELAKDDSEPYRRGIASYVLGRILVETECLQERREDHRRGLYLIAAKYFDEADLHQVPPDLQPEVHYWWGRSLFLANELVAARPPLVKALAEMDARRNEILRYLAMIHLNDDKIPKQQGVAYVEQLLQDPTLNEAERREGLALKTKLLLQNEQLEQAAEIYRQLPDDAPELPSIYSELGKARLREAAQMEVLRSPDDQIRQVYQLAVEAFEQDSQDPVTDDLSRATKRYLLARAQKGAGELDAAAKNFAYVRRQFFDRPIGIAAGFWESVCLLEQEYYDEAKGLYAGMLKETVRPNNQGESEWLNRESITAMVQKGVDHYLQLGNYAAAVELSDQFRNASLLREPEIPLSYSAQMKAASLKKWIEQLEQQVTQSSFRDRPKYEELLNEKYHDYGHSLYSLAVNRFASTDYAKDLYEAGEAFFRSGDYRRATLAFKQYLDTNDDTQAAQTRLRMGQSLLAQRDFPAALEALSSCWALYPNDPVVYQARFQAAQCYLELANPEKAQEMLRANLDNDALTPSSQEWIESLFLLGNLLFEEGLRHEALAHAMENAPPVEGQDPTDVMELANEYYSQAIQRLAEAVTRAPELPAAKLGLYHLAESYRRSNTWNRLQLSRTTVNARRIELTTLIRKSNEKAILYLEELETLLNRIRESRPWEENEEALLRNSYFTRGNLYYQLNQFDEAISMYRMASNMVIQQPEVLEAYVQISSCYRKLNKQEEATRVINQAKILLRDRIPVDADFEATTRFTRDRWVMLLDWLSTI